MSQQHLATYLNDHLAGAVVALELLAHLEKLYPDTPVGRFCAALRAEIAADRAELEGIMARLDVSRSVTRRVSAWFAEKMSQLKLRLDDPAGGPLLLLEALDALSTGIEGKRLLWCALSAAAADTPALQGTDYARLDRRAEEQRTHVETVRVEAAKAALGKGVVSRQY